MGTGKSPAGKAGGMTAPTVISNVPTNPTAMTDAQADALRDLQDSQYDANTTAAVKMYISNTDFDGYDHSLSQTMNFLEEQGVDLNTMDVKAVNKKYGLHLSPNDVASMQFTSNYMQVAMHPLGQDTILQRGAHDDLLRNTFGIQDYTKMSTAQLKQQLVGQAFRNDSHMSTSYDISKNPFLGSGSGVSGGREIIFDIKAGANTKCLFGAKKQSEIILGKGQNFKITDVKDTGRTATPRNGRPKRQIVISIETF